VGNDLFETPGAPAGSERVLLGTSGYSFPDWVGTFYPPGTKPGDFLRYYAEHFNTVEVNSTYYGIPHPRVIDQMEKKTPAGFHFMVKVNKAMTHEDSNDPELFADFLAAIEPLKAAGKYDGLLAQFPSSFRRTPEHVDRLRELRERLPGEPLFIEFRHRSWLTPELKEELRAIDAGYTSVDEPRLPGLMPPDTLVTTRDAYVRLHGRNERTWWAGDRSSRYDYSYSEDELREWLKKIASLADQARRTYLFFNNCHAGQAARNAKLMQELLRQQKLA